MSPKFQFNTPDVQDLALPLTKYQLFEISNPQNPPTQTGQANTLSQTFQTNNKTAWGAYSDGVLFFKACCSTHLRKSQAFDPIPQTGQSNPLVPKHFFADPLHPTTLPQTSHHKGKLKCWMCLQGLGSRLLGSHLGSHLGTWKTWDLRSFWDLESFEPETKKSHKYTFKTLLRFALKSVLKVCS